MRASGGQKYGLAPGAIAIGVVGAARWRAPVNPWNRCRLPATVESRFPNRPKHDAAGPKCPSNPSRCPRHERPVLPASDRVDLLGAMRPQMQGLERRRPFGPACDNRIVDREPKFQPSLPSELFARIDNEDAASVPEGIITTTIGKAINWGRKNSIWPMFLAWRAAPSR